MLRLRSSILTHLLSSSSVASPNNLALHRLLSAISPNPSFAVGDYLVDTCGLTRAQAIKASVKLSHLKSPSKPDAVLAFLAGLGLSSADVAAAVAKDPQLLTEEKIAAKVDFLKKTFRWSDAEVSIALAKFPLLLRSSKDMLRRSSEFLISEVGLEPVYIAHRPVIICYSLEGRLRPRYYVLKFLRANGLLDHDWDYYNVVNKSEAVFVKKFICAHKEAAPHLADDYAATCKGEVPTNFRFT